MTLTAEGLRKRYGDRWVLDGIDLEARPDEIVGLLGPNGAGKTTAFRILAGLVVPDAGGVRLSGTDVTRRPLHARARAGLGYLSQEASAFRRLTVADNLSAVLELQPGVSRRERASRVEAALAALDLTSRRGARAGRLSGGERRRLELARCLVTRPRWLLLDEPFAGIDPVGVRDLQARLRALRGPELAILLTDHLVHAALPLCDRAYLLQEGRIIEAGTRAELAQSPVARATYLGMDFYLPPSDR